MYRSHPNIVISWWRTMVYGFIYLIQGLTFLFTFGIVTPNWDMNYTFYCSKKDLKKRMEK